MKLHLEIVTPENRTFSDQVDEVVLPGIEGEFGVLPGHTKLVTQIQPGELVAIQNGKRIHLAVGEGFVEVLPTHVAVLTDMAIREEDIDEKSAEDARKRAEDALNEKHSSEQEATLRSTLQKSLAQLNLKRRRRG